MPHYFIFSSRATYTVFALPASLEKWLVNPGADLSAQLSALHALRWEGAPLWAHSLSARAVRKPWSPEVEHSWAWKGPIGWVAEILLNILQISTKPRKHRCAAHSQILGGERKRIQQAWHKNDGQSHDICSKRWICLQAIYNNNNNNNKTIFLIYKRIKYNAYRKIPAK